MNKSSDITFPAVGVVSLLVIFSVLCLTVFAMLAISTVQTDKILSAKAAEAVTGYYRADCEAEKTLAQLRSGEKPEYVVETDGIYSYTHTISETQTLVVEVMVEGENYDILRCSQHDPRLQDPSGGIGNCCRRLRGNDINGSVYPGAAARRTYYKTDST